MAKQSDTGASAPVRPSDAARPAASAIVKLTKDRQYEILREAAHAGASDEEVADLKRLLRSEDLTVDTVAKVEVKIAELVAKREGDCQSYWLKPGCSYRFHGTTYKPGEKIRLTEAEAAEVKEMLASKPPPPKQPPVDERKAGKYRVKGPGSIKLHRKIRKPGEVLDLDATTARELGDYVEQVME